MNLSGQIFKSCAVAEVCSEFKNLPTAVLKSNANVDDQKWKVYVQVGIITDASGSAYVEYGNTKLLAAVYGPKELSRDLAESATDVGIGQSGHVSVHVRYAPFARKQRVQRAHKDRPSIEEQRLAAIITDSLKAVVLLHTFPKAQVVVYLCILEESDISALETLSASLSGVAVALADAGIEIYDLIVGASCSSFAEDADLKLCIGQLPTLGQIVCYEYQGGGATIAQIKQLQRLCVERCNKLYPLFQQALLKSLKR